MALIGFKNTHNQEVYINPAQILYVMPFEEGVTIVTFAAVNGAGKCRAGPSKARGEGLTGFNCVVR